MTHHVRVNLRVTFAAAVVGRSNDETATKTAPRRRELAAPADDRREPAPLCFARYAPQTHSGGGLHIQINPNGSAWWRYRYRFHGIEKMLSIGVYPAVDRAAARGRRDTERKILSSGRDPSALRQSAKRAHGDTFQALATDYYDAHAKRTKL